jgi:hypothetical protein
MALRNVIAGTINPHLPKRTKPIAVIGIDIGKNSFHVVDHDKRGAIVLRQKWSRGQEVATANRALVTAPCLPAAAPQMLCPEPHLRLPFCCASLSPKPCRNPGAAAPP